ncbi:MAG: hypothetical protein Q4P05_00025 [Actinomycetaceae bacterium]|nr:hypothetical protein [Actinomycetaceae bacterium]
MSITPVVPLGEAHAPPAVCDDTFGKISTPPGKLGDSLEESGEGSDRLERARRSLLQAERSLGVAPVTHFPASSIPSPVDSATLSSDSVARAHTIVGAEQSLTGRVWHCLDGNAVLFRALASVCEKGQWIGFLGLKNAGWCAAREQGIDLRRSLIVPDPSPSPSRALAAMIDGLDIVVCDNIDIPNSVYRSISGRVRARNCLLFTTRVWSGISQPWRDHATYPLQSRAHQHEEAV